MVSSLRLICGLVGPLLAAALVGPQARAADDAGAGWLVPSLTYDGAAAVGLGGGLGHGSRYGGNLHLKLRADGSRFGWPGDSAFMDVLTIHGGRASALVGDAQGVNNLEGPAGTQIEELWLQHNFGGSSMSVLVGIYDLNSEFYRLLAAGLFVNSAFGIGAELAASGVEGPSIFPRTAFGLRWAFKPAAGSVLRLALLDGVPVARPNGSRAAFRSGDGLLGVAEWALLSRDVAPARSGDGGRHRIGRFSALTPYADKLAFGFWHYTGRTPDLVDTDAQGQPLSRPGGSGAYVVGERRLLGGEGRSRQLSAFAQIGVADPRTNRFNSHVGAGLVGSGWGLLPDSDQFGIAVTRAGNGSHYMRAQSALGTPALRSETTLELTFLSQLTPHVSIQPSLQHVRHPGTDPAIANATVLQVHFEVSF
jgi:porin